MTREKNLRFLISCARTGKLMGFMLAPLCASWPQARNRTNVIRNYAHPWDLPQSERGEKAGRRPFSLNDQAALDLGNKTSSSALRLSKSVHRTGTPWIFESPFTSICWQTPEARALAATEGVQLIVVDSCASAMPWRKRTGLLFGNCDPVDVEVLRKCKCTGVKKCSYTGKDHIHLSGGDPTGIPWTKRAEPYPTRLARRMAHMLLHREYCRRMC